MGDPDDRLANIVAALAQELDGRVRERVEHAAGLRGAAPAALVSLHEHLDGATLGALHDNLGVTHSGAVRLVDRLEDAGLVRRSPGADERSVAVTLTAAGRRVARRVLAERSAAIDDLLGLLGEEERRALTPIVERLIAGAVGDRLARRAEEGIRPPWLCRMCDFEACGRPAGECPAANAATAATAAEER